MIVTAWEKRYTEPMCGIAGFVGGKNDAALERMITAVKHRGPDDRGLWSDGEASLAQARLAIIDLSPGGHQPMHDVSDRYTIVFNGEIYNYKEVRQQLPNYPFRSQSDTEVILAAYATWGSEGFKKLNGMFAVALWDAREHTLLLVRDRLGKKPLYWILQNNTLVFGSELKALREHPAVACELDPRSLSHYVAREYVPTPRTIYKDIYKLPPANILTFKNNKTTTEPFWSPCEVPQDISEAEALTKFESLLDHAVSERLIADVPLGVFLSGGIDSSTVAYFAKKHGPTKTFSIGFSEKSFDESDVAARTAKFLGTEHRQEILSSQDALSLVSEIPQVFDEPVADVSVLPTMLLSRFTRKHVTVALGGDGADELLLGYQTFLAESFASPWSHVPAALRTLVGSAVSILPTSSGYMSLDFKLKKFTKDFDTDPMRRHLQWLGSFTERELASLLTPSFAQTVPGITEELAKEWKQECNTGNTFNNLSHLYLRTYCMDQVLVKVDRASMHYALEMRAPFLDKDVTSFLLSLPPHLKYRNGRGKWLLRKLMRGKIPDEVLDRPKHGFSAPVATWLRTDLKPMMIDLLSSEWLARQGIFNPDTVEQLMREHLARTHDHRKKLWTLLIFQMWYDIWIPKT